MHSFLVCAPFLSLFVSSCTKKEVVTETVTVTNTTTVQVRAVDTVFSMNAKNWNAFSYQTLALIDSGAATYQTTSEGIKITGQAYRLGTRLQTKTEFGLHNKAVYMKWKASGGGQFAGFVPQLKYDILSNDGLPAIQGVDFDFFSVGNTSNGSVLIQNNTWYYTRIAPVGGTDNYIITTATGGYSNQGGNVFSTKTIPVYTKSGYLAFRIGDPFGGTGASAVLGECKITGN